MSIDKHRKQYIMILEAYLGGIWRRKAGTYAGHPAKCQKMRRAVILL